MPVPNTQLPIPGAISLPSVEAGAFVVTELSGLQRKVTLKGRTLPYRGVGWGVHMRTAKTVYPGNPIATQAVIGVEYPDTEIRGMWKDRFVAGDATIENAPEFDALIGDIVLAQDLVIIFESLVKRGQPVRVQWGPRNSIGILKSIDSTYQRTQDIEWRMVFDWSSSKTGTDKKGAAARDTGDGGAEVDVPVREVASANQLFVAMNNVSDTFVVMPPLISGPTATGASPLQLTPLTPDYFAQLVSAIASARRAVGTIFDAIRKVTNLVAIPGLLLGTISSAIQSVRFELLSEISRLTNTPTRLVSSVNNLGDQFRAETWRRDMALSIQNLLAAMDRVEAQARELDQPDPINIYDVVGDTTLYVVSNKFYATPDFAYFLRRVNFLEDVNVRAGTRLIIPPKPAEAAA